MTEAQAEAEEEPYTISDRHRYLLFTLICLTQIGTVSRKYFISVLASRRSQTKINRNF